MLDRLIPDVRDDEVRPRFMELAGQVAARGAQTLDGHPKPEQISSVPDMRGYRANADEAAQSGE
jgi:hypothetical protein